MLKNRDGHQETDFTLLVLPCFLWDFMTGFKINYTSLQLFHFLRHPEFIRARCSSRKYPSQVFVLTFLSLLLTHARTLPVDNPVGSLLLSEYLERGKLFERIVTGSKVFRSLSFLERSLDVSTEIRLQTSFSHVLHWSLPMQSNKLIKENKNIYEKP